MSAFHDLSFCSPNKNEHKNVCKKNQTYSCFGPEAGGGELKLKSKNERIVFNRKSKIVSVYVKSLLMSVKLIIVIP